MDEWHTAVRTLKYQIGTVFPRDQRQVNSYLPRTKRRGRTGGGGLDAPK
ncbi:MAG: hypothetical protein FJ100_17575 [Deltaproteobacteria bacterium]|nr:hypothetical protein [Deltaproteobacteria bacterium]